MTTSTGVRAPSPVLSHVELADAYAAGLSPEDLATFDHLRELHRSDDGLPHVLSDEQRRVLGTPKQLGMKPFSADGHQ